MLLVSKLNNVQYRCKSMLYTCHPTNLATRIKGMNMVACKICNALYIKEYMWNSDEKSTRSIRMELKTVEIKIGAFRERKAHDASAPM